MNSTSLSTRLLRAFARLGLVRRAAGTAVGDADPGYFEWESGTAAGVWEYYARYLPGDQRGLLVVDVASGPGGRTLVHASISPATFVALDQRVATLRATRDRTRRPNLTCVAGDAYSLPFSTGSVDVALCENAMEHFDQPARAVAEMSRVLKPGGWLLMVFPPWRAPYAGHLGYLTRCPWVHLLPSRFLSRFLEATILERDGPEASESARRFGAAGLGDHLNQVSLQDLLDTTLGLPLELAASYLVPEWRLGRVLRFLPVLGEYWTSAVYLAFRKTAVPSHTRLSLLTLQRHTVLHRRVRPQGA